MTFSVERYTESPSLTMNFYPTALKGCQGIVFTHGGQMGEHLGRRTVGKVRAVSQRR